MKNRYTCNEHTEVKVTFQEPYEHCTGKGENKVCQDKVRNAHKFHNETEIQCKSDGTWETPNLPCKCKLYISKLHYNGPIFLQAILIPVQTQKI